MTRAESPPNFRSTNQFCAPKVKYMKKDRRKNPPSINCMCAMPSPKVSTDFTVVLFGVAGLILGSCSLGSVEKIFYTTKPFAFLDSWHLWLFIALFVISFACIPFAASRARRPSADADVPTRGRLVSLLAIWMCVAVVTAFLVSIITATIHHKTLSFPDWLIPAGLWLVPAIPCVTILLVGFWGARRNEPCA